MAYANGFVPASALAPLDGQPGCSLRADAAAAWNAARAEVKRRTGIVLTVRGWNRTHAEQVTFYLQRHRLARAGERVCCYWQGRPYKFTGTAHAAPPGTSNHGWGLAVDVTDFGNVGNFSHPRRVAAFPILAQYGWTDTEGRGAIREPWHLVWNPSSAWAVSNPIGGGGSISTPSPGASSPAPLTPLEEDDDMLVIARTKNDPQVWIGNGVTRRRVSTQDTLKTIQFLAAHGLLKVAQNGAVQSIEDLWALGHPVADDLGAVQAGIGDVPASVWGHRLTHTLAKDASGKPAQTPAGDFLRYTSAEFDADRQVTAELVKSIPGVDPAVIADAVKSALRGLSITLATKD